MGFDDHQLRFENARLKEEVYIFNFYFIFKINTFVSIILIENLFEDHAVYNVILSHMICICFLFDEAYICKFFTLRIWKEKKRFNNVNKIDQIM